MASWAQRMHKRAADLGSVVTSCGHPGQGPYPHRLEKVKFGVALDEVCKNDIPGPLLVLILKLNKEAPLRKDVFRAPGHQGAMKKLIHFLQSGRLVNVDNYSVYTIASVLKKFLRKIPNGIFGREGESELFALVELEDEMEQQERIHRLIMSLPIYTQRLLVLLFGTFRVIASNAERSGTGMTSEALGVSVAPSFFQSCVSDGKTAKMEDVSKFKVATKIMKQMIDQFAVYDLFGHENYEFYARVTGRILKVKDEWICSFQYPPPPRGKTAQQSYAVQLSLEAEKTWLQCECERWGLIAQEESQSTPALLTSSSSAIGNSTLSLGIIPEHSLLESCTRLSISLEGPSVFAMTSSQLANNKNGGNGSGTTRSGIKNPSNCSSTRSSQSASLPSHHMTMDELRAVNRYAESTKSLTYLPQVHERQAARMRTRSEWFLGAPGGSLELAECDHPYFCGSTDDLQDDSQNSDIANNAMLLLMHHHHQYQLQQQQQQHHQQQQQQQQQNANNNQTIDSDQWKKPYERSFSSDHAVALMETNFPPISGTFDEQHANKTFINNNNNQNNNIDSNISNRNRLLNINGTESTISNRNTIDCDIILHHHRPLSDFDDESELNRRESNLYTNDQRNPYNRSNYDHVVRFASQQNRPRSVQHSNRSLLDNSNEIISLPSNNNNNNNNNVNEEVDYILTARSRHTQPTSRNTPQNENNRQQPSTCNVSLSPTGKVLHFSSRRSSRRNANVIRQHRLRSSLRRNKENGKNTSAAINALNVSGNELYATTSKSARLSPVSNNSQDQQSPQQQQQQQKPQQQIPQLHIKPPRI